MAENVAAACKNVRRFKWLFLPFCSRVQHLIYGFQISVLLNHAIVQQPFHHPQTDVDKPSILVSGKGAANYEIWPPWSNKGLSSPGPPSNRHTPAMKPGEAAIDLNAGLHDPSKFRVIAERHFMGIPVIRIVSVSLDP